MSAISARGLTLRDGLRGVEFQLPLGSCTAVLGPNGAGKSTLMGLLAGSLVPDQGSVHCLGPVSVGNFWVTTDRFSGGGSRTCTILRERR